MLALADILMRAELRGDLRFFLVGGRALEAHGVVRFTKDVDLMVATGDLPAMNVVLTKSGYKKAVENQIFSRWTHPSMTVDDVDVMVVSPDTFEKLLLGSVIHRMGPVNMRVPGVPSLIALKLHAIKSNPDRLEKDGRDIAELLKQNPDILDRAALETLFTKYGCSHHFSPFSHLAK
jgi:hypothetical protein